LFVAAVVQLWFALAAALCVVGSCTGNRPVIYIRLPAYCNGPVGGLGLSRDFHKTVFPLLSRTKSQIKLDVDCRGDYLRNFSESVVSCVYRCPGWHGTLQPLPPSSASTFQTRSVDPASAVASAAHSRV